MITTSENSICIRCERLRVNFNCKVIAGGGRIKLLSDCYLVGKNVGDRKTCSKFKPSSEDVIKERLNAFKIGG